MLDRRSCASHNAGIAAADHCCARSSLLPGLRCLLHRSHGAPTMATVQEGYTYPEMVSDLGWSVPGPDPPFVSAAGYHLRAGSVAWGGRGLVRAAWFPTVVDADMCHGHVCVCCVLFVHPGGITFQSRKYLTLTNPVVIEEPLWYENGWIIFGIVFAGIIVRSAKRARSHRAIANVSIIDAYTALTCAHVLKLVLEKASKHIIGPIH